MKIEHPERILVRLPTWVGDVVMATPALRALATAHPQATIVCEGRGVLHDLVVGLPGVTGFLAEPGKRMRDLRARVRSIAAGRFDWAIVLPDSHRAAAGPFLARVPVRAGYAFDFGRKVMLTDWLGAEMENGKRIPISMIERYLMVTRLVDCPDDGDQLAVPLTEPIRQRLRAALKAAGLEPGAPYLSVVPGAAFGASKLWPIEFYARAATELHAQHGLPLVMAPGPGEEPIAHAIRDAMDTPVYVLEPIHEAGLLHVAAMIEGSSLCLSNDTGPRHFAVAAGVPVVVMIGPTDSRTTDHQLERQRVLREDVECSPCLLKVCPIDHRCMIQLSPDRVISAANELLAAR